MNPVLKSYLKYEIYRTVQLVVMKAVWSPYAIFLPSRDVTNEELKDFVTALNNFFGSIFKLEFIHAQNDTLYIARRSEEYKKPVWVMLSDLNLAYQQAKQALQKKNLKTFF